MALYGLISVCLVNNFFRRRLDYAHKFYFQRNLVDWDTKAGYCRLISGKKYWYQVRRLCDPLLPATHDTRVGRCIWSSASRKSCSKLPSIDGDLVLRQLNDAMIESAVTTNDWFWEFVRIVDLAREAQSGLRPNRSTCYDRHDVRDPPTRGDDAEGTNSKAYDSVDLMLLWMIPINRQFVHGGSFLF